MVSLSGEVLYLSPTYGGSVHDKKICELEQIEFLKKTMVMTDLGFLGLSSTEAQIIMPHKRKKNKQLSQEQEQWNKWVSKIRVKVEHIIASVKIYRKVKEKFRGRLYAREDTVMLVACALNNLKVKVKYSICT
jgi:hypothetical protein